MLKVKPERIYLRYMHLGDIITSFNILYNLGLQYDLHFEICGQNPDVYKHLFHIFDYRNHIRRLEFCPWKEGYKTLYFSNFLKDHYLNVCMGIGTVSAKRLNGFCLPTCKLNVSKLDDFLCFHFQCRSVEERKSFDSENIKHAFKKFEIKKSICIGGNETKKYIHDRDAYFGDLSSLACKLLESSGFFGIDSGMAHLAGTLGVQGDVIIQAKYEHFFMNVKNSFEFMYPSMVIHSKNSIAKIPVVKI